MRASRLSLPLVAVAALALVVTPSAGASSLERSESTASPSGEAFQRLTPAPVATSPSATSSSTSATTPSATATSAPSAAAASAATSSASTAPARVARASAAKSNPALTIEVRPLYSGSNELLTITGEIYSTSSLRPLTGRPIIIQTRPKGDTKWYTVTRLESNNNGAFRTTRRSDRDRDFRAFYAGNSYWNSKQSPWARTTATAGTKVRASARLYQGNAGSTVRGRLTKLYSNQVRPLRGANVEIQALRPYGTTWFVAGRSKTDANGYYNWNTSIRSSQCYRYRVIYKGNSTWAAKSIETYWSSCS